MISPKARHFLIKLSKAAKDSIIPHDKLFSLTQEIILAENLLCELKDYYPPEMLYSAQQKIHSLKDRIHSLKR